MRHLVISACLVLGPFAIGLAACGDDGGTPSPDAGTEACPPITGAGVEHRANIEADETWTVEDSPHIVPVDLTIRDATLTIEACAEVRIAAGRSISVGGSAPAGPARLVARGERRVGDGGPAVVRGIEFRADVEGTRWGSIRVYASGSLDMEEVHIQGGGEQSTALNLGGTIVALGAEGPALDRKLRTVNVEIDGSGGFGVNLQSFAAFTEDSRDLVIRGAGAQPSTSAVSTNYPIYVAPPAVQSIPIGQYTGNAVDAIQVFDQSPVRIDETFHDRGVPYQMQTGFSMSPIASMSDGGLITLTLEAGVVLKFNLDSANEWGMNLGTSNGEQPENLWPVRLVANGTSDRPIVLTSAEATPVAGDWSGIEWRAGPSAGNSVSYLRMEYAGGDSGSSGFGCGPGDNDAALIIANWRPDESFISNSTFANSAGGGIVSGWRTDDDGPNLKTGNTFMSIANGCEVSRWSNITAPACPGNDAVPDCL